jgi:hypothetical protein
LLAVLGGGTLLWAAALRQGVARATGKEGTPGVVVVL